MLKNYNDLNNSILLSGMVYYLIHFNIINIPYNLYLHNY